MTFEKGMLFFSSGLVTKSSLFDMNTAINHQDKRHDYPK